MTKGALAHSQPVSNPAVEVVILAGGLSTRMGGEKSRLRLGRRSLLGHVRDAAKATGWPVRVIRRDRIKRCGPLGGIYSALLTSKAEVLLFLACDMPFVTAKLIGRVVAALRTKRTAAFCEIEGTYGFPFALRREVLPQIESRIRKHQWSLQSLARSLGAAGVQLSGEDRWQVFNVNTRDDLNIALQRLKSSAGQS